MKLNKFVIFLFITVIVSMLAAGIMYENAKINKLISSNE